MTEDFYDLLEVSSDASQDEIKEAYREKVRVYHPDLNDDDRARAQFTAVKTAYEILGDPVERGAYDRLGHEEYVSKRTSGLPSPDVWRSDSDDDSGETNATAAAGAAGATASSATGSSGSTASTSGGTAESGTATGSSGSTASTGAGTGGSGTAAGSTTASDGAGTAHGGAAGTGTRSNTGAGATDGRATAGTTDSGRLEDNPVARWWRRQNFSLPLIWLSLLVYLGGLVHFGSENTTALEVVRAELGAAGLDPDGVFSTLTETRHGVDSSVTFLSGVEFVSPPVDPQIWYVALSGLVGLVLLVLLVVRVMKGRTAREPLTIDETIVFALALAAATGVVGGPLLAGAVLMPVLFTVVLRHTRRGRGWKPSYLYLVPVLAPLAGIAFAVATPDQPTLFFDLVAFVLLPLVGALGLPLRATIRKRFGA